MDIDPNKTDPEHQSINQSTNQSCNPNQSESSDMNIDQSINQSTSTTEPINQSQETNASTTNQSTDQSTSAMEIDSTESSASSTNQSTNQSTNESINQSSNPSSTPSTNQSINQSTNPSGSTDQSTNQSTTQSINQSISLSDQNLDPDELQIQRQLKLLHTDVQKGTNSTRAVLKILQNLQKNPAKLEVRRLRRDQIIVKKQVVDVPGAQQILELVGYKATTINNLPYFFVEEKDINQSFLEKAIKLLLEYTERQIQDSKKPVSTTAGVRSKCAGGCGFFGDAATENLCSVCYNKKYLGAAATKQLTGIDVDEPKKCVKGCGLFGSAKLNGMCSQCHAKTTNQPAIKPKRTSKQQWRIVNVKLHSYLAFLKGKQSPQQNKNRCFICNKKLPVPIECRCRRTFCSDHRFPLDHQCSYDTRSEHKKTLRKNLIVVASDKFDRI